MQKQNKSPIGQILVRGGFLSARDLELALAEQQHTNELLGQVLVRMGVLDPTDLQAALEVQKSLAEPEDAVKIAAGTRKMLGDLLVQAGHLSGDELGQALAEQKKSGEKLGAILLGMGLLNDRQLSTVLDFQQAQAAGEPSPGPLKFGEIMVSAGYISQQQLDEALQRQNLSGQKLGEVLIEGGYVTAHHVTHGIRLQQMLLTAVLAVALAACGGGGDTPAATVVRDSDGMALSTSASQQLDGNYFVVTSDEYGLLIPTFYYSSDNEQFWTIQADIAEDVSDQSFLTVMRMQITKDNGVMPAINKTFSIEETAQYEQFPGVFLIPNGQESTYKKVEQGLLTFDQESTPSGEVKGSFDVVLTDYESTTVPAPQYQISGIFYFKMGTYS